LAHTQKSELKRHTEELEEIITKIPSWIIRWGITLFFCVLLIAVAISVLIRYPDRVKVPFKLQGGVRISTVTADRPGKIFKVFVKQGQVVKKGEELLQMQGLTENVTNLDTIRAPCEGKLGFSEIVEPGVYLDAHQEIFQIHSFNEQFFGVVKIPQTTISKVKEGQDVLIILSNYPSEKYGQLKGKIDFIMNEPSTDGSFMAKITINKQPQFNKNIPLTIGMMGEAQIITGYVSLRSLMHKSR
jgi:multidrug resistance efflux pump